MIPPAVLLELSAIDGDVFTDELSRSIYAKDASIYEITPALVVAPRSNEDVRLVINLCRKHQIPIIPRGAGTSLVGQSIGAGLVLDCSVYMNQLLDHSEARAVVQPGLVRDELNRKLLDSSCFFAPDPATSNRATFGGMIANNSSGMRSIRYGMTSDHVEEVELLLSSGTTITLGRMTAHQFDQKRQEPTEEGVLYQSLYDSVVPIHALIQEKYPKVGRHSGGYPLDRLYDGKSWNLASLICGSEGTLGIILSAKVLLKPLPRPRSLLLMAYSDRRLDSLKDVATILDCNPSALEILDAPIVNSTRFQSRIKSLKLPVNGMQTMMIVELDEQSERNAKENLILKLPMPTISEIVNTNDQNIFWAARNDALAYLKNIDGPEQPIPYIEDAAIPIHELNGYVTRVLEICAEHGKKVTYFGHAGAGVIHIRPMHDVSKPPERETLLKIQDEVFEQVVNRGGAWSGEHGDGLTRSSYNREYFGAEIYRAFEKVKNAFDPVGIMNPGKVLREGHALSAIAEEPKKPIDTQFQFSQEGGLLNAVQRCSGIGVCRKTDLGVMCPSFQVLHDERHSPRGRVNGLKHILMGQGDLADQALKSVMDLCLGCKACISECPNTVDVAKMKSESLNAYQKVHGVPLSARLFSNMDKLLSFSFLANAPASQRLFRSLSDADPRRSLPKLASKRFSQLWSAHSCATSEDADIILIIDTNTEFCEPEIGLDACFVLTAAGLRVKPLYLGDSQRAAISHGMLDQAIKRGARFMEKLGDLSPSTVPILVLEPSDYSALKYELPDLIEVDASLLSRFSMVDEYLFDHLNASLFQDAHDKSVIVHGHCHQRAHDPLWSPENVLSLVPGLNVHNADAGCCGMAGSFGYLKKTYELSVQIANHRLIPRLKEYPEAIPVANGVSCRQQIFDLTGRRALHSLRVVRKYLIKS